MTGRRRVHDTIGRLCGSLFDDPARLRDVVSHRVTGTFTIRPHRHDRELQLDLLDGCRGAVTLDGRAVEVGGLTLLTHYPGQRHGFTLTGGRRWHVKVACDEVADVWPEVMTHAGAMPRLRRVVRELSAYSFSAAERPPRMLALVADLLASWPVREVSALDAAAVEDERDLAEAVKLVQASEGRPPTVGEMARAAHLSPRQFARRFRARFGTTPADFADRHRLACAKALLLGGQRPAAEVAAAVGFTTHSAFTRWFTRHAGQTPSRFRLDPQTA